MLFSREVSSEGSYDQQADMRDCFSARYDPLSTDVDVDGITAAVASVVVNICLRILITWSPAPVDEGVGASLLQIYPILISTLASINRKQLSLFDANFALVLCSSPLTGYLAAASIGNLFGISTGLYKRIHSHPLLISVLATLVPLLWFGLSVTLTLSDRAFVDSGLCKDSTFKDWLWDFYFWCAGLVAPGVLFPFSFVLFGIPFLLLLFRRRAEVQDKVRSRLRGRSRPWVRRVVEPYMLVKYSWCIVDRRHRWFKIFLFLYVDVSWAYQMIRYAVLASGKEYVLSYGQVLFVFHMIHPVVSTGKFLYRSRLDLFHFIQHLPRLLLDEAMFIVTGKEPAPSDQDDMLPLSRAPSSPLPRVQECPPNPPPEEPTQRKAGPSMKLPPICEEQRPPSVMNASEHNSSTAPGKKEPTSLSVPVTPRRMHTFPPAPFSPRSQEPMLRLREIHPE